MIFGMVDNALLSLVKVAIPASTVVVLCALGVMLAERVGVLNLGQEGLIGIGAVYAVIAATDWGVGSPWISMLVGMVAAATAGDIFAVVVVVFRANQILAGLALAIGGIGLSNQLGVNRNGTPIRTLFAEINPGGRFTSNAFLETFFFHDPVVYIAYILLPAAFWFLLFRTRHGMHMKAVGENPASADAAGVNGTWARIGYSVAGASLAGAGGASGFHHVDEMGQHRAPCGHVQYRIDIGIHAANHIGDAGKAIVQARRDLHFARLAVGDEGGCELARRIDRRAVGRPESWHLKPKEMHP